jgi:ABC-type multidrug transport system fused ATPase/permease subunit
MNISLKFLFYKYKVAISTTFLLLTFEAILLAMIPFGIGIAIDSLVKYDLEGIYILTGILFVILFVSTIRRMYDTRVYSTIYSILSTSLIKKHKKQNIDTSIVVTRSSMVQELVDVFEHDLTNAYTSLVGVFTALLMIFYINTAVALICIFAILLIILVYLLSEVKIYEENAKLNSELENRLNIINKNNIFLIPHFRKIKNSMVRLSDIESYNYIMIQILIAVMIISSIFIGMDMRLSVGEIFALVTYVLNFSFEILTLPVIFQQFIRLKEITTRINNI